MTVQIGDPVGNLTFLQPDGTPVALPAFKAPVLLLLFLRHLG